MAVIETRAIVLGGIADSAYLGAKSSVQDAVGLDLFSTPGLIKLNQALSKESGNTIDSFIRAGCACSNGKSYFFGQNGKVWERDNAGVYTHVATLAPSSGGIGALSAIEYGGYIYYACENRLGRVAVASSIDWSGRNDNFASFDNGDADFHPMRIISLVLYIGDGNLVAQVDAGVFSPDALDIPSPLRIKSLGKLNTDLLLGTYVSDNITKTQIIRWNTWSVSFSYSDDIPENGINAFIDIDNGVLVSAGTKGNFYIYDGQQLHLYKTIPGDYVGKQATIYSDAVLNFHGLPLFGVSNQLGNPTKCGIWSLGQVNQSYPRILNREYLTSPEDEDGVQLDQNIAIGVIVPAGDIFLVSWMKQGDTPEYGIDVLDLTKKHKNAGYTTRAAIPERDILKTFKEGIVHYKKYPENTSIKFLISKNYENFVEVETVNDTTRKMVKTTVDIGDANVLETKVILNPHNNEGVEIEGSDILI